MKKIFNFGEGGIKEFLFLHVEKFISGMVAVLVLCLLWTGLSKMNGGSLSEISPQGLASLAQNGQENIQRDTWAEVAKSKGLEPPTYESRVPPREIQASGYQVNMAWDPPLWPSLRKRTDPRIVKPMWVEATAGYGTLAMLDNGTYKDEVIGELEAKRIREERQKALKMAAEAAALEAKAKNPPPTNPNSTKEKSGRERPGGRTTTPPVSSKETDPLVSASSGSRSSFARESSYSVVAPLTGNYYSAPVSSVPLGTYFVSVRAVVPVKEQSDAYRDTFGDSVGYDRTRDAPRYLGYIIERQQDDKEWVKLSRQASFKQNFAGVPGEIADSRYLHDRLTEKLPPLLQKDLTPLAIHKKVPTAASSAASAALEKKGTEGGVPGEAKTPAVEEEENFLDTPGTREDGTSKTGRTANTGRGGPGQEGTTMRASGENESGQPETEYALLRFFDFDVEPGKSYRYRVQLVLEDPNHPKPPTASATPGGPPVVVDNVRAIPNQWLDANVLDRIRKLDAVKPEANSTAPRAHLVESPKSDPSESVTVPVTKHIYAGMVKSRAANPGSEPSAKLLVVVWDKKKALEVPAEIVVQRGSVVDFTQEVEVLHAVQQTKQKIPNYSIRTNALVLDIRGGDPLTDDKKNPLSSPGEILLVDPNGQLVAKNELDDVETYRRYRSEPEVSSGAGGSRPSTGAADSGSALEDILIPGSGGTRNKGSGGTTKGRKSN